MDNEILNQILQEIQELKKEVNEIKNTLNVDIKENCQKMGGHIAFVENVYDTVKTPLSYISNKIGGYSLPTIENKK